MDSAITIPSGPLAAKMAVRWYLERQPPEERSESLVSAAFQTVQPVSKRTSFDGEKP